MVKRILLLGASLESDNKGVNALGIGAITLLRNSFEDCSVSLLQVGNNYEIRKKIIFIDSKEIEVTIYYFPKYDFLKSIVESFLWKFLGFQGKMKISKLINEHDLFFDINEGDSFSDIYGSKRIIRHFFDSQLIISWRKDLTFLPQTIGPFNSRIGKLLAKFILKKLKKVYVRDTKATEFLKSINVDHELTIDMAVYMNVKETKIELEPNTIGININGLMYFNRYGSMAGNYEHYKEFIFRLIKHLMLNGYAIYLVPHTYNSLKPNEEDDLEAIKDFLKINPELSKKIKFLEKDLNAQELKFVFSKMDFFLGSRMHSCIGALSKSVPTIGLAYSYKFDGTFKMFDLADHVIEISNISKNQIEEIIATVVEKIGKRKETRRSLEKQNMRQMPKIIS